MKSPEGHEHGDAPRLTPVVALCISALLATGCVAQIGDAPEGFESSDEAFDELATSQWAVTAVPPEAIERSILVRRRGVMEELGTEFDMGYLLAEVARFENEAAGDSSRTVGAYVHQTFARAAEQQDDYAANPAGLGVPAYPARRMGVVLGSWRNASGEAVTETELQRFDSPEQLRGQTFRMLAIANRMDLAGEFDDRPTAVATWTPRYLGEVHLLFGLVVPDWEAGRGRPFPMTFVVSYRLPVLRALGDGSYEVNEGFDVARFAEGGDAWRNHMRRWGRLWAELSEYGTASAAYRERLAEILRLAVRPENFISLKSNAEVRPDVFELREWYVVRHGRNGQLIPRKPRREPYPCLAESRVLTELVDHYWVEGYADLDMTTRRPHLSQARENQQRRAGYAVLRDDLQSFYREDGRLRTNEWDDGVSRNYYFDADCGVDTSSMPFRMLSSEARNDPPTGDLETDQLFALAPFARVEGAGRVWELDGRADERVRHAFAIRTCSGCHSQEGATRGFHVFPRLAGEDAAISAYLSGERGNRFSHEGPDGARVSYSYDTLEARRQWLQNVLDSEAVLFDSLMRPERHR